MNREIKFRGKGFNSRWIYGYYYFNPDTQSHWLTYYKEGLFFDKEVIPETIGQFIGLVDKKEREIFEDDLVEKNGVVYKITWNNLHAMWGLFTKSGQSNEDILCDTIDENGNIKKFWQDSTLTIIGNTYDNQKDACCENCLHFPPIGINKFPCSVCENDNKFETKENLNVKERSNINKLIQLNKE